MSAKRSSAIILAAILLSLCGCDSYDSDNYPYGMKGLNVYVHNDNTGEDLFAGFVEANYLSRSDGTSQCGALASSAAVENHLKNWSYVCCTVTSDSDCVTKVR